MATVFEEVFGVGVYRVTYTSLMADFHNANSAAGHYGFGASEGSMQTVVSLPDTIAQLDFGDSDHVAASNTTGIGSAIDSQIIESSVSLDPETTEPEAVSSLSTSTEVSASTRPILLSTTPADDASAVPLISEITFTFNEPVVPWKGVIELRRLSDDSLVDSFDVTGDEISFVGSTVIISPEVSFPSGTDLYVYVPRGAFRDQNGSPFEGITDNTTFNFSTGAAPVVTDSIILTTLNAQENHFFEATDPEGDPLTYSLDSPPISGVATVNPDGTFSYDAPGFIGADPFTYSVTDGNGSTVTGNVDVVVGDGSTGWNQDATNGNDIVRDTAHDDTVLGLQGADRFIIGLGGSDSILAGDGTDEIVAQGDLTVSFDNAIYDGGADADDVSVTGTISILAGSVDLLGGSGNDTIDVGGSIAIEFGELSIGGGDQDDQITLGDQINLSSGIVSILGDGGYDQVTLTGMGDVSMTGGSAISVSAGADDDVIALSQNGVRFEGGLVVIAGDSGNDTITGGGDVQLDGTEMTLDGGFGDDVVSVADGSISVSASSGVRVFGGDGDDLMQFASGSNVSITGAGLIDIGGGEGNDRLIGAEEDISVISTNLILNGESGDDLITFVGTRSDGSREVTLAGAAITLLGEVGNDEITVADTGLSAPHLSLDADSIIIADGGDDDDLVRLVDFDATVEGGQVLLDGGSGNDTILGAEGGLDLVGVALQLDGGDGDDLVQLTSWTVSADALTTILLAGGSGNDTITGGGDVQLDGTEMTLDGGFGDDVVSVADGSISVSASVGVRAIGGDGDDLMQFASGSNVTISGSGLIDVTGGEGNDRLIGAEEDISVISTNLILNGEGGGDQITFAGTRSDGSREVALVGAAITLLGESGNDEITVADTGLSAPSLSLDADSIIIADGGADDDLIRLVDFDATVEGGQVLLDGGSGNDTILGAEGALALVGVALQLDGGDGDDLVQLTSWTISADALTTILLAGGSGNDTVDASSSGGTWASGVALTLTGDEGNDIINGSSTTDVIHGGADDDTITANSGNDTLFGGAGADSLDGGTGTDTASYEGSGAGVFVYLDGTSGSGGDGSGDTLTQIENLIGSDFDDALLGDTAANSLYGGDGDDELHGGAGADLLVGGAGTDVLIGGLGSDLMIGGEGVDILSGVDGGAADTLDGSVGTNIAYYYDAGESQVVDMADHQGAGNSGEHTADTWINITGFYGANDYSNTVTGDSNINELIGGSLTDVLYGGDNADVLVGRAGDDNLFGGADDDVLVGGAGADTLHGGGGTDAFYIQSGNGIDIISDWVETEDVFLFYQTGLSGYGDLILADTGADVQISSLADTSFTIIVQNAELSDLDQTERFLFI